MKCSICRALLVGFLPSIGYQRDRAMDTFPAARGPGARIVRAGVASAGAGRPMHMTSPSYGALRFSSEFADYVQMQKR